MDVYETFTFHLGFHPKCVRVVVPSFYGKNGSKDLCVILFSCNVKFILPLAIGFSCTSMHFRHQIDQFNTTQGFEMGRDPVRKKKL